MQDMKQTIVVLSKIRDCRTKECNYDCENCEFDYSTEELVEAVGNAIDACLYRDTDIPPRDIHDLDIKTPEKIVGVLTTKKTGNWVKNNYTMHNGTTLYKINCSCCGKEPVHDEYDYIKTEYCPHCGAEMNGVIEV